MIHHISIACDASQVYKRIESSMNWHITKQAGSPPNDSPDSPQRHGDLAVEEARPKLKPPSRYKVIMMNDDFTPMDFVVEVLAIFFSMSLEDATRVMLAVHTEGKAVCGVYSRDVAETKAAQVVDYARENQHPLMCLVEKA